MARLLVLLAYARTVAGVMDALDIKAVCEVPTDGGPRKIYLDMDAEAFEALAGPPGPDNSMSLPIDTTDCEPFKSAYINFSPGGHPAWDGKGDGYGVNHFDIHFYTITEDARRALMGTCVQPPGAGNCDASAPENAPFYVLPDAPYITGFVEGDTFGGHAVPGHGLHLLPVEDTADGGPAACKSTGPAGDWRDCQAQQLSLLGVPGFENSTDQGCACGTWTNGVSPILLSYDGQVVASEIMASQQHVKDLRQIFILEKI